MELGLAIIAAYVPFIWGVIEQIREDFFTKKPREKFTNYREYDWGEDIDWS